MFLGGEGNNIKIDITYAFYGFGALAGMTNWGDSFFIWNLGFCGGL